VSKIFTTADLQQNMEVLYPDVEDDRKHEHYEHPMTAVGIVLLSAALLETVKASSLARFTLYSCHFISAINLNMQNNKLWVDGRYDSSAWPTPERNT
jgi:hypothetical protein